MYFTEKRNILPSRNHFHKSPRTLLRLGFQQNPTVAGPPCDFHFCFFNYDGLNDMYGNPNVYHH